MGQPVICKITSLEQSTQHENSNSKRRIELSMRPDVINSKLSPADLVPNLTLPAMVESVQDHGYILSLGIEGVTGFIKRSKSVSLEPGQWIFCAIKEYKDTKRVATLTMDIDPKSSISSEHSLTIDALQAGYLVNATIKDVLSNGLVVSILGYFSATVDWFNLGDDASWDSLDIKFKQGSKFKARIAFCDANNKKLGLSLNSAMLNWSSSSILKQKNGVDIGTIIESAVVKRVDHQGLLLELPEIGSGYVHVSNLADTKVEKVNKKFKVGSVHKARVIGCDMCDSLILVTLQQSVIDQPIMRHADIQVGSIVKGQILKVQEAGVIVAITPSIRALCTPQHFSDASISQPEKLFKIGASMKFQVIAVDTQNKRVLLTHRRSLMTSQLTQIRTYEDAIPGMLTMGIITKVQNFGCIVHFYDNVRALVPLSELSDEYVKTLSDKFKVGQAVKCRILTVDTENQKLRASFKLNAVLNHDVSAEDFDALKIGQIVKGTVVTKTGDGIIVDINGRGLKGFLSKEHTSDHISHTEKLLAQFKDGSELPSMVILSKERNRFQVQLSMKPWLISEATKPDRVKDFSDIKEGMLLPGYVRNVTETACFIGFLGGFVAMATSHNIADTFVTNVADHFQKNQSVIACVSKVNSEDFKISVSLKESVISASASIKSFELQKLKSYFIERDLIRSSQIRQDKIKDAEQWMEQLPLGSKVEASVKATMPYGTLVEFSFGGTGLVTSKGLFKHGDKVFGQVLDVDMSKKIADLALLKAEDQRIENEKGLKKVMKACKTNDTVDAMVVMMKEDFAILTLTSLSQSIAYSLARGVNTKSTTFQKFKVGQNVKGVISSVEGHKYLFSPIENKGALQEQLLNSRRVVKDSIDSEIRSVDDLQPGRIVKGRIQSIKSSQLNITLGSNLKGRIHISEVLDVVDSSSKPFAQCKTGQEIKAKVIGFHDAKSHKYLPFSHRNPVSHTVVELTMKPSDMKLDDFKLADDSDKKRPTFDSVKFGTEYQGFVQKSDANQIWISVGPSLLGRVSLFDLSNDSDVLASVSQNFPIGMAVKCWLIKKDAEKNNLDFTLVQGRTQVLSRDSLQIGQLMVGKIIKIEKGLTIQLAPNCFARAHLTDLDDKFAKNPLDDYSMDDWIKCKIVEIGGDGKKIDVSLRPSVISPQDDHQIPIQDPEIQNLEELKTDTILRGYIRSISPNGCFVALSRHVTARVKIAELSDSYVKDWKMDFKEGQLVRGRIVSIDKENGRVEMSLKHSVVDPDSTTAKLLFSDLEEGMKIKGSIKAVQRYGVFIQLANSDISGLCHVSELSDTPVKNIEKLYSVGDLVKAIVLKIDSDKRKLNLGLKASYFNDMDIDDEEDQEEEDENSHETGSEMDIDEESDQQRSDVQESDEPYESMKADIEGSETEDNEETEAALDEQVEPLDLGSFNWSHSMESLQEGQGDLPSSDEEEFDDEDKDENGLKKSKRAKRRQKKEEEERIAKKELALLEGDNAPEVAEDFERFLLGSPSSSYLWIKYMAFQLQMTEIEKAREIGDRALKMINFRESQEKMNVWVALLNLENSYGTAESLLKTFEKAVSYNEPKHIYIQLSKIYENCGKTEVCVSLLSYKKN